MFDYKVGERLSWVHKEFTITGTVCLTVSAGHIICRIDPNCKIPDNWGWKSDRYTKYALPDNGLYWSLFDDSYQPIKKLNQSYKQIFMADLMS